MKHTRVAFLTTSAAVVWTALASLPAVAADPAVLTGTITAPAGEKLGGVTVSAKAVGSTITTTVFTDETGAYYFPPLPAGTVPRVGAGAELRDRLLARSTSRPAHATRFRARQDRRTPSARCGSCRAT